MMQKLKNALVAGAAAIVVITVAGVMHSYAASDRSPAFEETQTAEQVFADAPYGVDSTVTGPVSKEFRQQQVAAGCDTAKWPNVPMACYPN